MSCFWPVESELPRSWTGSSNLCGQALDEVEHVHIAGGLTSACFGDGFIAEADIFGDGAGEEEGVLQHDGEVLAEGVEIVLAKVDAIEAGSGRR